MWAQCAAMLRSSEPLSLDGVTRVCVMAGNTTPKRTGLGLEMKHAREAADISGRKLAGRLGVSPTAVSRWERGERVPQPKDVARYLAEVGAKPELIAELVDSAGDPDTALWLAVGIPEQGRQLATLLEIERSANKVNIVSPLLIPGMLQTADYARAIMTAAEVTTSEIDTRVTIRVGRRDAVTRSRNPLAVLALIGESALLQMIGGREVMLDQVKDLERMASLPNVELRIVPNGVGWHPALEGPFDLVEFDDKDPVVQLENRRSGLFFHRPEDTALYQNAVSKVRRVAMSPEESMGLIAEVINKM
jgi:transcriptional regulator with XRE-family HTH domain